MSYRFVDIFRAEPGWFHKFVKLVHVVGFITQKYLKLIHEFPLSNEPSEFHLRGGTANGLLIPSVKITGVTGMC